MKSICPTAVVLVVYQQPSSRPNCKYGRLAVVVADDLTDERWRVLRSSHPSGRSPIPCFVIATIINPSWVAAEPLCLTALINKWLALPGGSRNIGKLCKTLYKIKTQLSLSWCSVIMSFWFFAQNTAVILSCSVRNFKTIVQLEWMLWMTTIYRD